MTPVLGETKTSRFEGFVYDELSGVVKAMEWCDDADNGLLGISSIFPFEAFLLLCGICSPLFVCRFFS